MFKYRLNKQGDSKQLSYSFLNLDPISCSIQGSNCCFLTCIQVSQEIGKMVCYSHLFKSFPQFMIHTIWSVGVVDEPQIDVLLEFPSFLYDPPNVSNLISGSSSFSKPSLDISKFLVCIRWSPACMILSMTLLPWEVNASVQWLSHSLVLSFLGIGMRVDIF